VRVVAHAGKFGAFVAGEPSRSLAAGHHPGPTARQVFRGLSGTDLVRSRIALEVRLGDLNPGERLTDAGVISQALGVSEITVRRALEMMGQDGLLERRRGRAGGTFIATHWDSVAVAMRHDQQAEQLVDYQMVLECGLVALAGAALDEDALAALEQHILLPADADVDAYAVADAHFHLTLADVLGGWRARERQADLLGKLCLLLPKPPLDVAQRQDEAHAELLSGLRSGSLEGAVEAIKGHARTWPPAGRS
jgi:DNA-binding GntR family transcriptional regulator